MNAISNPTTLFQANRQWASRPADERFTSLTEIVDHYSHIRDQSRSAVISSRSLEAFPSEDNKGLLVAVANADAFAPTHWSFGQLAQLAGAPSKYLRSLPSPIAADCVNYGLKFSRDVEDVGLLLQKNGSNVLRAATGPQYGRVWNSDFVQQLVDRFGNGIDGDFRVPGEFGQKVEVTKDNTTLFAGDRDLFVFLADEEHRIEVQNRRDGKPGSLARGFFAWNSEVGSTSFGIATFLFDYVCKNRIVWGASEYREVRFRHTASAPEQFIEAVAPALASYAQSSTQSITDAIAAAQAKRVGDNSEEVTDFLAKRFGSRARAQTLQQVHELEEGRPIETLWDVTTAVTASARDIKWQNERVTVEREGGAILDLAV